MKKIDGRTKEGRALKGQVSALIKKEKKTPRTWKGSIENSIGELFHETRRVDEQSQFTQRNLNEIEKNFEDRLTILARTVEVHEAKIRGLAGFINELEDKTQGANPQVDLLEAFKEGYLLAKANGQAHVSN